MTIRLTHITLQAYHGVGEDERKNGNTFRVSVQVTLPDSVGVQTDVLSDTVNYQVLYDIVIEEMAIPSDLLEHVAGRIRKAIGARIPQAQRIEVTVEKKNPPLGGDIEWAGVTLS